MLVYLTKEWYPNMEAVTSHENALLFILKHMRMCHGIHYIHDVAFEYFEYLMPSTFSS